MVFIEGEIKNMYQIGEVIDDQYKIINDLGGGGFGKVLEVEDLSTGTIIALKYCTSTIEEDIRRFKREVRIMEGIEHENVINILTSNTEYNPPYFTMERALCSVFDMIPDLKEDLDKAIKVFESICHGINAIHASGHTHRDIKPHNALLFNGEKVVISDLGLAKNDNRDTTILTRASIYMGTDDYIAPEQMLHGGTRDLGHTGDVFQLGKTLYHMLTGLRPLYMNPEAIPIGLWYIIRKATRQNPEERYQTVGQLIDAVHDARRTLSSPKEIFDDMLYTAKENLKSNMYVPTDMKKLIQLIHGIDDNDDFIEFFHEVPDSLLLVWSTDLVVDFEPLIEKYFKIVEESSKEYNFSFAEKVANKMRVVIVNSTNSEVKKFSILSILVSAIILNRYAAMDEFDTRLRNIKSDSDAFAIADGLRENISYYLNIYSRIPKKELHPAIRLVWEQCENN
jgi:eukaryotic-like serine/threonine-protein kinase